MSKIDWSLAVSIAKSVGGRYPLEGTYHETKLRRDAPGLVARASELVSDETGLEAPGVPDVLVVSRDEWAATNVESFATLLAPAEERLSESTGLSGGLAGRIIKDSVGTIR